MALTLDAPFRLSMGRRHDPLGMTVFLLGRRGGFGFVRSRRPLVSLDDPSALLSSDTRYVDTMEVGVTGLAEVRARNRSPRAGELPVGIELRVRMTEAVESGMAAKDWPAIAEYTVCG